MVSYILDAIRYREGALAAIWLTLGTVNLSLWFSEACFLSNRPLVMSFMISICSGITLFATGKQQSIFLFREVLGHFSEPCKVNHQQRLGFCDRVKKSKLLLVWELAFQSLFNLSQVKNRRTSSTVVPCTFYILLTHFMSLDPNLKMWATFFECCRGLRNELFSYCNHGLSL